MHPTLSALLAAGEIPAWLGTTFAWVKVLIGFSVIIFVHELGHFLAAKWVGVRVDRFAVGFGTRLFGWRSGEGFTFGNRPNYRAEEIAEKGFGETDYCFKALPIGGYVKMLGQEDIIIDDKTGDIQLSDDPRAFTSRPVGQRMLVVSAGVVFNLIFAALMLMCVFLVGKQMLAPVIGVVTPDSPAQGKLAPGDRVLEADGEAIHSFMDFQMATAFADGLLKLKVKRAAGSIETVDVKPVKGDDGLGRLSVLPQFTTVRVRDGEPVGGKPTVLAGDKIIEIDGKPVTNPFDIVRMFELSEGRVLEVVVERPKDPSEPDGEVERVVCYQRAALTVLPALEPDQRRGGMPAELHILGLLRRQMVARVVDRSAAKKAGFERGDVVLQWGTVANPTLDEIFDSIAANPGKPISLRILRGQEQLELSVSPRRPFKLFGKPGRTVVGLDLQSRGEENMPIVSQVVPGSPFAKLSMPRGSRLVSLDGRAVRNWFDVVNILKASAGRSIVVRYRSGSDESGGALDVPSSIINELDLDPGASIQSIDGQKSIAVELADGKRRVYSLPSWAAVRKILETRVGQTVSVRYRPVRFGSVEEAEFTVRADNFDPWQGRIGYIYGVNQFTGNFDFAQLTESVNAHGNPLTAMSMGINYVTQQVRQIYQFLTRVATTEVSTEHVAGPVGIFSVAVEQARLGISDLLFFLAFISINLAVINFLPIPVMDGGLMLFLIIEKIKGKPLSFKTQMISTLVSLAAIILFGLFITIQDISRLF